MPLVVPRTRDELVEFYRAHLPAWQQDPEAIGLSSQQVAALTAAVEEAEAGIEDAIAARQNAQACTLAMNLSLDRLRRLGSGLMATIRSRAQATGDKQVYLDAQIPFPRPPSPTKGPQTPTSVRIQPRSNGQVTLRWEGTVRSGHFYTIERSLDGARFTLVGSVGAKTWTDDRIPPCTKRVEYWIRGRRGERSSPPAQAIVSFYSSERQVVPVRGSIAA